MARATQTLDQLKPDNPHVSVTVKDDALTEPECPGSDDHRWRRLRTLLTRSWANKTKTVLIAWDANSKCWKRWEEL